MNLNLPYPENNLQVLTEPVVIHWFRRDLRLYDNQALKLASHREMQILPIFIFDPEILDSLEKDDKRVSFIFQALKYLDIDLAQKGSYIRKYAGNPADVIERLTDLYSVKAVFTNHDYEPYAQKRDCSIRDLLLRKGIEFITCKDQVIFEKEDIVKNDGTPYTVFTPYSSKWKSMFEPSLSDENSSLTSNRDIFLKGSAKTTFTLDFVGFKEVKGVFKAPIINEELIARYDQTRNFPAIGTSHLGVHLRFGTISIRHLVSRTFRLNSTWLGELQWREFFMQILWHYPYVVNKPFKAQYERILWRNDEGDFQKWCFGETGYPLVDAGMRELLQTGVMHNRVRMVTASFLTKHLLIDWRWGESWFAQKLLDFELASNNGNWQWSAGCGCDAAPYFRIFNPRAQADKFDPDNLYVKRWIPEFNTSKYPKPIVDHNLARNRCLEAYSAVRTT
ncbi:MAG: deoxyribodipyrimidine photo-lyase [Bacteroidetes bacterium]|nr:deoxyribodipyrimidine photo-lyase [Bacteroidota bacterium]